MGIGPLTPLDLKHLDSVGLAKRKGPDKMSGPYPFLFACSIADPLARFQNRIRPLFYVPAFGVSTMAAIVMNVRALRCFPRPTDLFGLYRADGAQLRKMPTVIRYVFTNHCHLLFHRLAKS